MPLNPTSRLVHFGAGLWMRRVAVLILGVIVAANLAIVTFAWSQHPAIGGSGILGAIWLLSLGAGFILTRLWRVRAPVASHANGSATPPSHRPERP